jgi:D-3-phosphoglycerate dehydrogenase
VDVVEAPDTRPETLIELSRDCVAIAACWAQVTGDVIRAADRCRIICRMGIGLDNIDIAAASGRGVPVTNVPDYCVNEVAEHALALLLSAARNVGFFHLRTKRGEYDSRSAPAMHRLAEQTLGIVGFGRIGRRLYELARGIGLRVLAYTPSGNDRGTGCRMADLPALLVESDFLSLHMPLTESTRHLLGRAEFARMKRTAWLINTSRGGLVDPDALHRALQDHKIAGACLDVFEPEPPDLTLPLYQDERVLITPHAAFVSVESLVELRTRVARQIIAALGGERPENVVNPQVYRD